MVGEHRVAGRRGRRSHCLRQRGLRWIAGAAAFGVAAASVIATAPLGDAPVSAATPRPHYHSGSDTATFTVTGVLDSNCLISTGGTEVWIRPGDAINFKSSLVGIDIASINPLGLLHIAGLNVDAVIDQGTSHQQKIHVTGGKTTAFPNAARLSSGDHTLTWTSNSVNVLGVADPPLSPNNLSAVGASLSWSGIIHVTTTAPQCKLAVSTPTIHAHVGPINITVPGVSVGVPTPNLGTVLPSLTQPGTPHKSHTTTVPKKKTTSRTGFVYTPMGPSIPDLVVPQGGGTGVFGDTGGFGGVLPGGSGGSVLAGGALPGASTSGGRSSSGNSSSNGFTSPQLANNAVNATNASPSGQLPVVLAIIAIIALSLVTATYARLFLLRRSTPPPSKR